MPHDRESAIEYQRKKRRERWLDNIHQKRQGIHRLLVVLHSNSAQCHLRLKEWREAVQQASAAIELDSSYAKSYYRRAVGQSELGNVEAALSDLKEVKSLSTKHQWKHCEARMLCRELRQGGGRLIFPTGKLSGNARTAESKAEVLTGVADCRPSEKDMLYDDRNPDEGVSEEAEQAATLQHEMLTAVTGEPLDGQVEFDDSAAFREELDVHERRRTLLDKRDRWRACRAGCLVCHRIHLGRREELPAARHACCLYPLGLRAEPTAPARPTYGKPVVEWVTQELMGKSVVANIGRITCVDLPDFEGEAWVVTYNSKRVPFYDFHFVVVWELGSSESTDEPLSAGEIIASSPTGLPPPKTDIPGSFGRGTFVVRVNSGEEPPVRIESREVEKGAIDASLEFETTVLCTFRDLQNMFGRS
ncbi:RNA polymerase II-associated protein 3 [Perkinsus olseni]|uniref:RNA polymerase II-associated protein 3 n=1 Tax=Perkinsus olseni TaxID=32597 RepID=A0A7J6PJ28_PEROL|nr:RNA polymerase II-associated protein 3 [Perkinsus olseni]